jgi:membrane protease YdiL (CAAX protease family)
LENNMTKRDQYWTFGPALCTLIFFLVMGAINAGQRGEGNLLRSELILSVALVAAIVWAKRGHHAGWYKRIGWAWLWIAGPMWLAIISPLGTAAANISAEPGKALFWIGAPIFVGLNEEILFRGFLLRGLTKLKGPIWAAVISSCLFSLMHALNAFGGADPIFLTGQMMTAFGIGIILSAITLRAGSIWPAVFLHFAADAAGLSALGGFENATQSPEVGIGMMVMGVVSALWGGFWLWKAKRNNTIIPVNIT